MNGRASAVEAGAWGGVLPLPGVFPDFARLADCAVGGWLFSFFFLLFLY